MPCARHILIESEQLVQLTTGMNIFVRWRFMHNLLSFSCCASNIRTTREAFPHLKLTFWLTSRQPLFRNFAQNLQFLVATMKTPRNSASYYRLANR
jgi:hypothetical protein